MRFHAISAALVAATAFVSGVAANDVATTTLTRTLQRVVETVTQTRPSGAIVTGTAMPSYINGTAGTYSSPTVTASAAPTRSPGAASNLQINAAGLAAVAGVVGLLAL